AQAGSNPVAVSLSADEKTLYVANSGNNDVAVVDVRSGRVRGLIPTGWYPTSAGPVRGALFVTHAQGPRPGPHLRPRPPPPAQARLLVSSAAEAAHTAHHPTRPGGAGALLTGQAEGGRARPRQARGPPSRARGARAPGSPGPDTNSQAPDRRKDHVPRARWRC